MAYGYKLLFGTELHIIFMHGYAVMSLGLPNMVTEIEMPVLMHVKRISDR